MQAFVPNLPPVTSYLYIQGHGALGALSQYSQGVSNEFSEEWMRLLRPGPELRVELNTHHKVLLRLLHYFHKPSIW